MPKYTDTQKAAAVKLYDEHGTAETAKRTGITPRTIRRWAKDAGHVSEDNAQKTTKARAAGAQQVAEAWGNFREAEATGAGTTATKVRDAIVAAVDHGRRSREARDLAVVYGILIDKAELLSGNATQRVQVWAEDAVDAELRAMLADLDEVVNRDRQAGG
jgi:transposase-like protein